MRTHDRVNDKVCSTSKVLGNLQRPREGLRDSPSVSGRPRGFLIVAYGSAFWPVVEWVEDQDNVITNEALLALTESESFDIVLGAAPSGLEALRRLARRWDPLSGGKRRACLRQISGPQDFPAVSEKWEEVVRRYERSKSSGTTTAALEENIKTAALEALVQAELKQHFAMIRARLITYEQVRSEIQAYTEARRSHFAFKTVAAKNTSDPMDVDSFGNGDKKGNKGER